MRILPAPADHGVWFSRVDVGGRDGLIPARWDVVEMSPLCTRIRNGSDVSVSTIEHVMAALAGCGVHNALIEIDGPEVPIIDGSSIAFVRGILDAGLTTLGTPVRALRILKPVRVTRGEDWACLEPSDTMEIAFHIDFADQAIGRQSKSLNMANGSFVRELCASRTFCRKSDVDWMRQNGLALGGTFENAVVVDGADVLSPGGLRQKDEAVRHKMLDALGDLFLAGAPLLGRYTGYRAGHALTNQLLRALFAQPDAFAFCTCGPNIAHRLPGHGVVASEIPHII